VIAGATLGVNATLQSLQHVARMLGAAGGALVAGLAGLLADLLQRHALRPGLQHVGCQAVLLCLQRPNACLALLIGRWLHQQMRPVDQRQQRGRGDGNASRLHALLPCLSRSGRTHSDGKLIELPTLRVGAATADGLRRLAAAEGMPLAEFVRTLLDARVFGAAHVESLAVDRIRRVVGTGAAKGPIPGSHWEVRR